MPGRRGPLCSGGAGASPREMRAAVRACGGQGEFRPGARSPGVMPGVGTLWDQGQDLSSLSRWEGARAFTCRHGTVAGEALFLHTGTWGPAGSPPGVSRPTVPTIPPAGWPPSPHPEFSLYLHSRTPPTTSSNPSQVTNRDPSSLDAICLPMGPVGDGWAGGPWDRGELQSSPLM